MKKKIKLREIAHARAGDKGEINNICLFAYKENDYKILKEKITPEVVRNHFKGIITGAVKRYEVPSLCGLNFVLYGARRGGVSAALDLDTHGKAFSSALLELEIEID